VPLDQLAGKRLCAAEVQKTVAQKN
jgi:hypothetical protein